MICFACNINEVAEEFERCPACEVSHKALCAKLDAKPRTKEKKVKETLYPIKEMKNGILVTTWIDRNDAAIMGIKI